MHACVYMSVYVCMHILIFEDNTLQQIIKLDDLNKQPGRNRPSRVRDASSPSAESLPDPGSAGRRKATKAVAVHKGSPHSAGFPGSP